MAKKENNKENVKEEFAEEVNAVDVNELKAQMYEEVKKQVEAELLTKQSIEEKATTVKSIQKKRSN